MAERTIDPEDRRAHLEMIQAVIARMGSNSFTVKTWAVGLPAALVALAASKDANPTVLLVALLPILLFWAIDAFCLQRERLYRRLYDAAREDKTPVHEGPFTMKTDDYEAYESVLHVAFTRTVWPLYTVLAVVVLITWSVMARVWR